MTEDYVVGKYEVFFNPSEKIHLDSYLQTVREEAKKLAKTLKKDIDGKIEKARKEENEECAKVCDKIMAYYAEGTLCSMAESIHGQRVAKECSEEIRKRRRENMKKDVTKYIHHDKEVSVFTQMKGLHREYCLCYQCKNFIPENRQQNCPIANNLFKFDQENGVTTPVWECEEFEPEVEKK